MAYFRLDIVKKATMTNSVIRRVLILGVAALIGIVAMQTYWVVSTWGINEEEFNKKVNLALYRVANTLAELNRAELPSRDIVKQRATNYYIVNIEDEINSDVLEYLLQKELEALALNIDFEYAIFDCHTNEMVYGGYCNYEVKGPLRSVDVGKLPVDSEFTYYFGVKFPTRSGFLLGKMQLSVFFSVILLVTVLFFAYSMAVILRQKRLSDMQKDFINNMTHEFKTPLSTIQIAAGAFRNDRHIAQDERLLRYANIILEQNERLNRQVEKVLQLAKIEQGNFAIKREVCSLHDILQPVISSVAMRVEEAGGKLVIDLPDHLPQLEADRLHLSNILHNLLDNAIKYCAGPPCIHFSVAVQGREVIVTIADNGIGIGREHLPRVFDKFYRVPTGNVHNVKGFGLGLFYVKHICDAHGWKIRIESTPGEGATVSLYLRLAATPQPELTPLTPAGAG